MADLSPDIIPDLVPDLPTVDSGPLPDGVATIAGSSVYGTKDGFRTSAQFDNPVNVVVGPGGDLFVADFNNRLIRRVTPEGLVSTILTGPPTFQRPFGIVFSSDGILYVQTDFDVQGNLAKYGALWSINLTSGIATLELNKCGQLRGLAALPSPDRRLVATDYLAHIIQLYDPQSKTLTLLAGTKDQPGYLDGSGPLAKFSRPYDAIITSSSEIIVADFGNHRLRKVTLSGEVSTWAGDGNPGADDGPLLTARFHNPQALAIDNTQTIYVSDIGNNIIRKITPAGQVITIAGDGTQGYLDHLDPLQAKFFGLEGLDVMGDGTFLFVADGDRGSDTPYHRIRRITLD